MMKKETCDIFDIECQGDTAHFILAHAEDERVHQCSQCLDEAPLEVFAYKASVCDGYSTNLKQIFATLFGDN